MVPLLFPFTYVSDRTLNAMAACFQSFAVYQPSDLDVPESFSAMARPGGLTVRSPAKVDPKRLAAVLKAFRNWAQLHQGQGLVFAEAFKSRTPFFDDTLPSRLRGDILRRAGGDAAADPSDALFEACVFLQVSQELDRQNAEVQEGLERVSRRERELFEGLWGPAEGDRREPSPAAALPAVEDPGARMTSERIGAWTWLLREDPEPTGLFITDSRAVFDRVMDSAPASDLILSVELAGSGHRASEPLSSVGQALLDGLQSVGEGKPPAAYRVAVSGGEPTLSGSLRVHRAAGVRPVDFFRAAASLRRQEGQRVEAAAPGESDTLVGLITTQFG